MLAALWPTDTTSRLHLLTLAAFAGVEAIVFTSLYTGLPNETRQAPDALVVLLIWLGLMGLALLRRSAPTTIVQPRAVQGMYLAAYLPILLISLVLLNINMLGLVLAALLALLVWWRGLTLGQSHLSPQEARTHFWLGLGLVTVLLAFDYKLTRIGLLMGLALLGLLALMLSQFNTIVQHNDISPRALTRPAWRKALGLVLLAAFGLIALDAVLLNSEVAAWVVQTALTLIIIPITLVVGFILMLLQRLIPFGLLDNLGALLQRFMLGLQSLQRNLLPPDEEATEAAQNAAPIVDPQLVLFGLVLGIIVIVLLLLAGGMGLRRAAKRRREIDAMPTAYTSAPDNDNETEEDAPGFLRQTFSRWFAAATIRLIYARMSREAAKRGFERKPSQTTQEFLPALQLAFPGGEADAQVISNAYEAAHYGQVPDSAQQLAAIREAWQRVRQIPPPAQPPTPEEESLGSAATSS
ncbi:MAG: DUF4129 domain-containing protein [Anaerolineae bacterium]|nr:DUF4129 domain-containing protein [Anaerolineae bacterium]